MDKPENHQLKDQVKKYDNNGNELAIRFGLAGIKAIGVNIMKEMVKNRQQDGQFQDIYDFAGRLGTKIINKKSVEALSKAGAFDTIHPNRQQIFVSCEIIGKYSAIRENEKNSNQMSLFDGTSKVKIEKPALEKIEDWSKNKKLQKEFEAFGFFVNQHPLDDFLNDLGKRGVISSKKLANNEVNDNDIIKLAGVTAYSKHRSGPRGRYAYLTLSDPISIFETSIFNEELITNSRDLMQAGQSLVVECLVKKDQGGTRLLVRNIQKLDEFIKNNPAREKIYQDIKQQPKRKIEGFDWKAKQKQEKETNKGRVDLVVEQLAYQKKIEELKNKKVIPKITIEINQRQAIFDIKSFLSQKLMPENLPEGLIKTNSKIFFLAKNNNNNFMTIELPKNYLLDDNDVNKIKSMVGVTKAVY